MTDWMTARHRSGDPKPTSAPEVLRRFWTMTGDGRTATAVLLAHLL
jgi:hypothetical protein